jgi:hypothetical protein
MPVGKLFDGVTADGNSAALALDRAHGGGGRAFTLIATGTWGGGTITLQLSPDGGTTWVSTSYTLSANGEQHGTDMIATHARLNLAGATTPDLDAWLFC